MGIYNDERMFGEFNSHRRINAIEEGETWSNLFDNLSRRIAGKGAQR